MRFTPQFLDELRARLPVSGVVGRRVKLRKAGREWKGLSPFNKEKTPSFTVNDEKGFYHDFSSNKHGSIFDFVMESEGVSFPEAVERLAQMAGIRVSTGWMASVRGKAAALVASSGFMEHVAALLKTAPAVHVDETPARAAGGTRYVHLACTRYLSHLHTGTRSADDIDAGGVLPGYSGIIVRDGYAGYAHLTGALHAWCGVHLLRDLKALYDFEPARQSWAKDMAGLLIEARDAAAAARAAGQAALEATALERLLTRYRELAAAGLTTNLYRRTATAKDARRLARRFRGFEDLILRFVTRPDLDIFSNNEGERAIRPTKVQMRSSGGCWRTLQGLADFALVQSYLSTATKWSIDKLDALRALFTGSTWMPPGLEPD